MTKKTSKKKSATQGVEESEVSARQLFIEEVNARAYAPGRKAPSQPEMFLICMEVAEEMGEELRAEIKAESEAEEA